MIAVTPSASSSNEIEIGAEEQPRAQLFGARLEKWFKKTLRNEDAFGRTDIPNPFVEVGDEPGELLSGERLHGHDGAVLHELLVRLLTNHLLNADGSENLHRALTDLCGARVNRRTAVMFDHQRRDAVMAEQECRRHSDEASARDEDWTVVGHVRARPQRSATRRAYPQIKGLLGGNLLICND